MLSYSFLSASLVGQNHFPLMILASLFSDLARFSSQPAATSSFNVGVEK